MQEYLGDTDHAYDRVFMSCKLRDYFGERILISSGSGKAMLYILTLRESADDILRKYYSKPKDVDTSSKTVYY